MQIEKVIALKRVEEIAIGECFEYDKNVFQRIDVRSVNNSDVLGVNVFNGQEFSFDKYERVKPLKTKLIIFE